MWRLMFVTFGFLGFAFYELSGGASYEPAPNSLQARGWSEPAPQPSAGQAEMTAARAATQTSRPAIETPDEEAEVDRIAEQAARAKAAQEEAGVILASVFADGAASTGGAAGADLAAIAAIDAAVREVIESAAFETPLDQPVFSLETYAANSAQGFTISRPTAPDLEPGNESEDLRQVTGEVANMRTGPGTEFESFGRLTRGTQVTVLAEPGNGWVMLEVPTTGETGWMADWLVTASN